MEVLTEDELAELKSEQFARCLEAAKAIVKVVGGLEEWRKLADSEKMALLAGTEMASLNTIAAWLVSCLDPEAALVLAATNSPIGDDVTGLLADNRMLDSLVKVYDAGKTLADRRLKGYARRGSTRHIGR